MGNLKSRPRRIPTVAESEEVQPAGEERAPQLTKSQPRTLSMLLFGCGEGGKTTLFRSMKMHNASFGEEELRNSANSVRYSVYDFISKACANGMRDIGFEAKGDANVPGTVSHAVKYVMDVCEAEVRSGITLLGSTPISKEYKEAVRVLLSDPQFLNLVMNFHRLAIPVTYGSYFLQKVLEDGWGEAGWIPSNEDMLNARIKTIGMMEHTFELLGRRFKIYDVGGQRSEMARSQMMLGRSDVVAFVASLSEYDEVLWEDKKDHRLRETLRTWHRTLKHPKLAGRWFLLMFNKIDLFEQMFSGRDSSGRRVRDPLPIKPTFKISKSFKPPVYDAERHEESVRAGVEWYKKLFFNQAPSYYDTTDPSRRIKRIEVIVVSAFDGKDLKRKIDNALVSLMDKGAFENASDKAARAAV